MKRSHAITVRWAAAVVAVGVVGSYAYERWYAAPRSRIRDQIEQLSGQNASLEDVAMQRVEVRRELRRLSESALSGRPDWAEHLLRTGLASLAGDAGLGEVVVGADHPTARGNPYAKARRTKSQTLRRMLQDQRDFAVFSGSVRGNGTLEQVTRAVALADCQPWLHRLVGFTIRPVGDARDRFDLTLSVEALYVPDLAPESAALGVVEPDASEMEQWAGVVEKNVFRYTPPPEPPPVTPEPPPVVVVERPPPAPPYHEWRVAGVWESRLGAEVVMTNSRSGETLRLREGDSVLDATLLEAGGERAVFDVGGAVFTVDLNETLAQRRARE
ncbi:MAG: hypothetical protein H6811_00240 [Phycisphaeraceae bacterium]|nr:hypothetical protein [Phycisphaeraceae bacterium]